MLDSHNEVLMYYLGLTNSVMKIFRAELLKVSFDLGEPVCKLQAG